MVPRLLYATITILFIYKSIIGLIIIIIITGSWVLIQYVVSLEGQYTGFGKLHFDTVYNAAILES